MATEDTTGLNIPIKIKYISRMEYIIPPNERILDVLRDQEQIFCFLEIETSHSQKSLKPVQIKNEPSPMNSPTHGAAIENFKEMHEE